MRLLLLICFLVVLKIVSANNRQNDALDNQYLSDARRRLKSLSLMVENEDSREEVYDKPRNKQTKMKISIKNNRLKNSEESSEKSSDKASQGQNINTNLNIITEDDSYEDSSKYSSNYKKRINKKKSKTKFPKSSIEGSILRNQDKLYRNAVYRALENRGKTSADIDDRGETSADVDNRGETSADVDNRGETSADVDNRGETSADVDNRGETSEDDRGEASKEEVVARVNNRSESDENEENLVATRVNENSRAVVSSEERNGPSLLRTRNLLRLSKNNIEDIEKNKEQQQTIENIVQNSSRIDENTKNASNISDTENQSNITKPIARSSTWTRTNPSNVEGLDQDIQLLSNNNNKNKEDADQYLVYPPPNDDNLNGLQLRSHKLKGFRSPKLLVSLLKDRKLPYLKDYDILLEPGNQLYPNQDNNYHGTGVILSHKIKGLPGQHIEADDVEEEIINTEYQDLLDWEDIETQLEDTLSERFPSNIPSYYRTRPKVKPTTRVTPLAAILVFLSASSTDSDSRENAHQKRIQDYYYGRSKRNIEPESRKIPPYFIARQKRGVIVHVPKQEVKKQDALRTEQSNRREKRGVIVHVPKQEVKKQDALRTELNRRRKKRGVIVHVPKQEVKKQGALRTEQNRKREKRGVIVHVPKQEVKKQGALRTEQNRKNV